MWRFTTRRLLLATFWVAVACACFLVSRPSPIVIALAGLAVGYAVLTLTGPVKSQRTTTILLVIVMLATMLVFGVALAMQGR